MYIATIVVSIYIAGPAVSIILSVLIISNLNINILITITRFIKVVILSNNFNLFHY